ncbi:ACT domain-containing protein [Leptolyngbya iicbica]|uniref:ACT domain-containing protein n=2 Tax=Cyanophyceae TaxID=3028117 RepID=A0A4Q7EHQ4_9CYAN|nr:ACT domain-containing protein [Leptolyngbya sp. LK]RZM82842.1 ACT domain-containing protein [Leptolyngbya sp. LK]
MSDAPVGETQLSVLLSTLQPELHPDTFVFVTLPTSHVPDDLEPVCQFREAEGLTLIVPQAQAAQAQLSYQYPCRMITLTVHSSLAAVGMLAAITQALATEGISTNVVSAYFHDHLFVACNRVEATLDCLARLAATALDP